MNRSIVKRWGMSILGSTVLIAVALSIFICFFVKKQNYDIVSATLHSRANSLVMTYFNSEVFVLDEAFNNMANNFVNNFPDKNLMEVWVIDKNGNVVASSNGFSVKNEKYPDYSFALTEEDGIGEWIGKMSNNEKVMALTYILPSGDQGVSGAIRYIISLEDIDNQLFNIYFLVVLSLLIVIFFVIISGQFFIQSIIVPVRKINETAGKIAEGDFNVSVEHHKFNDELGQLCDTINNMAHEIGETNRMKNEFISTISHELRTPLTAIKGWGETIKLSRVDDELVDKGLDVIVNESDRLSELVEELLDFSRMESGKFSLKISRIDIIKEIRDVIETFESRSYQDGIKLNVNIDIKSLMINGDRNRLKQSFVNVIDNAFKYNKKDGFIDISVESNNDYITVIIEDDGCGISKFDLPRVTEKFYKSNNSVRGSGIGLAVTDEIIKMHNGELKIESEVQKGTKVSIILPRK